MADPVSDSDPTVSLIETVEVVEQSSQAELRPSLEPSIQPKPDEQALESHEVIELQTFSERKTWIEEKIKFLESLPPIEVFIGLESLKASAEDIPGLPTRMELDQWMEEHDTIEKETEIFDTGELTKLRQLTKAATQRNLSPEDTDVIELTLTTIYALDKLLHLLRDRSDNLEMMSIRLTWEENRRNSWKERRQIIEDLEAFSINRARWNPSIYEMIPQDTQNTPLGSRRGSVASLASITSDSTANFPTFSRSARFKLAELLSRDAAQFSGKVTSLKHGKVVAAGKALDRLIDHSRKPVPEELLDEQDRLEEKCITELENIGKFTMHLVMQWRKADEIYVETMKDHTAASNLLEEIETAKLYHPTARQSTAFTSRIDTILKRLAVRGDPASSAGMFPRPEHFLLPEQKNANDNLINKLSSDIRSAHRLARKVELLAKDYKMAYDAVKQAENLTQSAVELIAKLGFLLQQFKEGKPDAEGKGLPPDLHSEKCLDPASHSVFLAFLPSLLDDTNVAIGEANKLLSRAPSTLTGLSEGPVDAEFKENAAARVSDLGRLKKDVLETRENVIRQVATLREARRIFANINTNDTSLRTMRREIIDYIQQARWQQESGDTGAPPTLESPTPLASPVSADLTTLESRLSQIGTEIKQGVQDPIEILYANTEGSLQAYLKTKASSVKDSLEAGHHMLRLLDQIREQCSRMKSVRDDFRIIVTQIEDAKVLLENAVKFNSQTNLDDPDCEKPLNPVDLQPIQDQVDGFINGLSTRVSFVSRQAGISSNGNGTISHKLKSPFRSEFDTFAELPFELSSLDAAVRADSNAFAMRLSGDMEFLKKAQKNVELARMANAIDHALSAIRKDISNLVKDFDAEKMSLATVSHTNDDATCRIHDMLESVNLFWERRSQILQSMSPAKGILQEMDELSNFLDTSARNSICKPRNAAIGDLELQLKKCVEEFSAFEKELLKVLHNASKYEEEKKLAEERKRQEEELRLAREEAERLRLEQEKTAIEEKQRLLEQQLAEEQRQKEEREREALELAEIERLAKEAAESERIRVEKIEAEAEAIRKQKEEQRLADEEEIRSRLEKERVEMAEKLRVAESLLEEERRLHAEQERESVEALRKQQLEAEQLTTKLQMEMRRLAEEQLAIETAKKEKERADQERHKSERPTSNGHSVAVDVVDVFGVPEAPSTSKSRLSDELIDLQTQLLALRRRLRSISSNGILRPSKTSSELPTEEQYTRLYRDVSSVSEDFQKLRTDTKDVNISAEVTALRHEIEETFASLRKIQLLVGVRNAAKACDAALSDLLEHIDSYPAIPLSILSSSHRSSMDDAPEDQLSARLQFTSNIVTELTNKSKSAEDWRVESEHSRIQQTWVELQEMALDRINGNKSRPTSVISRTSSRSSISRVSTKPIVAVPTHPGARKKGSYSNLSVSSIQSIPSSSRSKMLAPPPPLQPKRRVVSGSNEPANRSTSRLSSTSTTRSVSGPLNSSLYGSTFASRQRTTSLTAAPTVTPSRSSIANSRSHLASETNRSKSPGSEHSSLSRPRSSLAPPRSVSNSSSWSRAPRDSFPAMMPRIVTPTPNLKKIEPPARKKYVANPKSKLDVAVGDVVNQLPVGINIEGITESWRDQSGKYWIGNQDPKLCFCRILRSQTVMVRVGGGWTELSRFIKEHFADSFRIAPLPDSPPRPGGVQEEKWISSTTLLEARALTPPRAPQTPEPTAPFLPSFSLMTPSGHSPHSLKSSPSAKGSSPLTPLQFMRRAEPEYPSGILRPVTPSKPPRGRISNTNTPSAPRTSVWRP